MFELDRDGDIIAGAKIKVVGVGGGGGNAVNTMIRSGLTGVDFLIVNTDCQALKCSLAETKIAIGQEVTKGLGAGANPELGRKAALEDHGSIVEMLEGSDMVFITAGMGGGTGTGAAPIIAEIAKDVGALTVGVVTKPFDFEGKRRKRQAAEGVEMLKERVDSLITIPNQRLLALAGNHLTIVDTFLRADEVLLNAVQGISDLINHTGLINSDFADVRTIMADQGLALMGTGLGDGEHRAVEAATNAISSPLLEDVSINGATGLIINITGSSDLTTFEVNEATTLITEAAHEDAEIIFGTVIDENMENKVKVTVIATGIGGSRRVPDLIQRQAEGTQAESLMDNSLVEETTTTTPPTTDTATTDTRTMDAQDGTTRDDHGGFEEQSDEPLPFYPSSVIPSVVKEQSDLFDKEALKEVKPKLEMTDLERARKIAKTLRGTKLNGGEYDIPTFIRRQQPPAQD